MVQDDTMKTNALDGLHAPVEEPMKIIHKEQDAISAFCLNQVKRRYMTSCVWYSSVANSGSFFENSLAVLFYVYGESSLLLRCSLVVCSLFGHTTAVIR